MEAVADKWSKLYVAIMKHTNRQSNPTLQPRNQRGNITQPTELHLLLHFIYISKIQALSSDAWIWNLSRKYIFSCLMQHHLTNFKFFVPCIFSTYGMKTNWCHHFIRILLDLYMFRAHRPIFIRVRTAVHTIIGSVSVPLCSRAVCVTTHRAREQSGTETEPTVAWTAVRTLLKMGLWARNM